MKEDSILKKPSAIFLVFIFCYTFWFGDFWRPIQNNNLTHNKEVFLRYSYLPSTLLFSSSEEWFDANEAVCKQLDISNKTTKYNYGSAILFSPFYFLATINCRIGNLYFENGLSLRFCDWLHYGNIIYFLIGIILLRIVLLRFFSEKIVALGLFIICFGSPLFHYVFYQSEMPEAQLFFLFSVLLFSVFKWHESKTIVWTAIGAISFSLISLIDLTQCYVLLFFIFFHFQKNGNLKSILSSINKNRMHYFLFIIFFVALWIPQLIHDGIQHHRIFYGLVLIPEYHFDDLRICDVFFNYNGGWLSYNPIMILSLFGLLFVPKSFTISKYVFVLLALFIVVVYAASSEIRNPDFFGMRIFNAANAWLVLPICFMLENVFKLYSNVKLVIIVSIFLSCFYTISITWSIQNYVLKANNITELRFWETFRKYKY